MTIQARDALRVLQAAISLAEARVWDLQAMDREQASDDVEMREALVELRAAIDEAVKCRDVFLAAMQILSEAPR